jgi:hypothetical protein
MTAQEAQEFLGVSDMRLAWLWNADYVEKLDQYRLDAESVERYARWRREAPRWRRVVRAATTPIRMM